MELDVHSENDGHCYSHAGYALWLKPLCLLSYSQCLNRSANLSPPGIFLGLFGRHEKLSDSKLQDSL